MKRHYCTLLGAGIVTLLAAPAHAQSALAASLTPLTLPTTGIGPCISYPVSDELRRGIPGLLTQHAVTIGSPGVESRMLSLLRDSANRILSDGEAMLTHESSGEAVIQQINVVPDAAGMLTGIRHQFRAQTPSSSADSPSQRALAVRWLPDSSEQRKLRARIAWLEQRHPPEGRSGTGALAVGGPGLSHGPPIELASASAPHSIEGDHVHRLRWSSTYLPQHRRHLAAMVTAVIHHVL